MKKKIVEWFLYQQKKDSIYSKDQEFVRDEFCERCETVKTVKYRCFWISVESFVSTRYNKLEPRDLLKSCLLYF